MKKIFFVAAIALITTSSIISTAEAQWYKFGKKENQAKTTKQKNRS